MPPSLATFLTFAFITALFAWDARRNRDASRALWLPLLWMSITASRFPSQWLQLGDPSATASVVEGNSLDATCFGLLILVGGIVLVRRAVGFADLLRENAWLIAFAAFGLVSVLWSDFPFIALKRWIKALGHPIMALIILTDPNPAAALRIVLRRCAFLLLPTSVLFIKYLPEYGRGFDPWTGAGVSFGVTLTKNDLGYVCMVLGLFFLWNILNYKKMDDARARREELALSLFFMAMIVWLLGAANSATSLATFVIGASIMIGLRTRLVSKRRLGTYAVVAAAIVLGTEALFDIHERLVAMLGRNVTLTDRTELWADVLALQANALVGAGFESFWLGWRLDELWAMWWWRPNQAHNGFIEIYLNLGVIGIILFAALLVATFRKIAASFAAGAELAELRLALFGAILAHNYTEATFKGVHLLWTIFHVVALDYRRAEAIAPGQADNVRGRWPRRSTRSGQLPKQALGRPEPRSADIGNEPTAAPRTMRRVRAARQ